MDTIKRLAIVIILFGVGVVFGGWVVAENASQKMSEKENLTPEQIVTSFYQKWKTEKNPLADGFHTFKTDLTDDFKNYLSGYSKTLNPVTCADFFPSSYSVSPAVIEGDSASVVWSGAGIPGKVNVGLKFADNRWRINSIICE